MVRQRPLNPQEAKRLQSHQNADLTMTKIVVLLQHPAPPLQLSARSTTHWTTVKTPQNSSLGKISTQSFPFSAPMASRPNAANGTEATVVFEDIPQGTYAIKVFHDANENSEHDTNFLGIPTESYGFSNDARGTFGPAKFADAKFDVKQANQIITITME